MEIILMIWIKHHIVLILMKWDRYYGAQKLKYDVPKNYILHGLRFFHTNKSRKMYPKQSMNSIFQVIIIENLPFRPFSCKLKIAPGCIKT